MPRGGLSTVLVLVGIALTGTGTVLSQGPDPGRLPAYGSAPAALSTAQPSRTFHGASRKPAEPDLRGRDRTPLRVAIQSVSTDAAVVPVAVAADGSLVLPESSVVGWWIGGAQPGDSRGTAFLAGHVDAADGSKGALYGLTSVRRGDIIRITTATANPSYRIVALQNYPRQHLPRHLFDRRGAHRLVLVTCGGTYDPRRGYSSNVVAYAVLANK
jgi:hypothetical protein